ncbi:hypothetical protein QBC38DRAFT_253689 [Podospora fimiseda]|uniref:Uncharacterized protein n=1 Tax=Podospora fimiseda TaxID=252190 RepID=A0AAN7BMH1_9PEZI|nr:hypothetical protein QBC38DRAFT_253689 [Podospora fimiseda]
MAGITEWLSSQNISLERLDQLEISYLTNFIQSQIKNLTADNNTVICQPASRVLPLANLSSLAIEPTGPNNTLIVDLDPINIDVGILDLSFFANGLFPSPLNKSRIGDIAEWWQNATHKDNAATKDFLNAVVNKCGRTFCKSGYITVGNPDIVGIGMIVAIAMLLVLTIAFSALSFGPLISTVARPSAKIRFSFRAACIGTVDELFSAVFVFALALIVSTFVFRYKTDTRFDALMANALSMLCATTVVMLAASYWAHNKERPHATGSVFVIAILTTAMFATHAGVANMHASAAELACGIVKRQVSTIRGDPFDMKKFHFVPVGFGLFLLALFGAMFHHPWIHPHRPSKAKGSGLLLRILWKMAQSLPSVAGLIGLIVWTWYFLNTWEMMKQTYGNTFSKNLKTWGFGQYLAIFTWLPPVLSFVHLFWGGLEVSLEKRLPQGWRVYKEDGAGGGGGNTAVKVVTREKGQGEGFSLLGWKDKKKGGRKGEEMRTTHYQFKNRTDTDHSGMGLFNAQGTEYQSPQAAYRGGGGHQSPDIGYDDLQVGFETRDIGGGHTHHQSPEVGYTTQGYYSDGGYPPTPADAPGYYRPGH